jgi:hypothetical protein
MLLLRIVPGILLVGTLASAQDSDFSYTTLPAGNAIALRSGETVRFPDTLVNGTGAVSFSAVNRSGAQIVVSDVASRSGAFNLTGLPILPVVLDPGRELRFTITFAPTASGANNGELQIATSVAARAFVLSGIAIAPKLELGLVIDETQYTLDPSAEPPFLSTPSGQAASAIVHIVNVGTARATIPTISITGTSFQVTDLPALPLILSPGARTSFQIVFAASQPGRFLGRLRVADEFFQIGVVSLGPLLTYRFALDSNEATVLPGNPLLFGQSPLGGELSGILRVRNSGTAPATVARISIPTTNSPFRVIDELNLPLRLGPAEEVQVAIGFRPRNLDTSTSTLLIDSSTFTLSGVGVLPRALPAIVWSGAPATAGPLQQPSIGLDLEEPYPIPVNGTVTLGFISDAFGDDATIRFSNGTRSTSFVIPAGETKARFANGSEELRLQTGTVAGTILLTPAFTTESGSPIPLSSPQTFRITIPPSPPVVATARASRRDATNLSIDIVGYATTRSLNRIDLTFASTPELTLQNPTVSIDVTSSFQNWFLSSVSNQFGSQFSLTIPLSLPASASLPDPVLRLQRVSITLVNSIGTSEAFQLPLQQ